MPLYNAAVEVAAVALAAVILVVFARLKRFKWTSGPLFYVLLALAIGTNAGAAGYVISISRHPVLVAVVFVAAFATALAFAFAMSKDTDSRDISGP